MQESIKNQGNTDSSSQQLSKDTNVEDLLETNKNFMGIVEKSRKEEKLASQKKFGEKGYILGASNISQGDDDIEDVK